MFKHLNAILYKTGSDIENINEDGEFVPYMVQRWCSMHSTAVTSLVNETTNRYWSVLDDKKAWYTAMDTVIPKCKFKKIVYLKKSKKDVEVKEKEYLQKVASSLEISTRELINYIRDNNLKITLPKNNE